MKVCEKIKKADASLSIKYARLNKYISFRIIIKLFWEIVLACLVALAVYAATALYNDISAISKENNNLNNIYISVSNEYVESLFGIPVVSEEDENHFENNYYLLDNAVLRTVSKDNSVVAYFITSKKTSRKILSYYKFNETVILGKTTYANIRVNNYTPKTDSSFCGDPSVNYYAELFPTGRERMYNTYVFGTVAYGFNDQNTIELLEASYFKSKSEDSDNSDLAVDVNIDENDLIKLREKARPNTYGVIANGYEEMISIIPQGELSSGNWSDIYYLIKD